MNALFVITPRPRRGGRGGFTLIELLFSITILAVLMLVVTTALDQTEKVLHLSKGKADQFREARQAFELITKNLSQATLNTYWDYYYASSGSNTPPANATTTQYAPNAYVRQSELQFLTDQSQNILGPGTTGLEHPGHAVFFQAPLGQSVTYQGVNSLLNGRGYYVEYASDEQNRPDFLSTAIAPLHYRYRLMEYQPPAEKVTSGGVNFTGDGVYLKTAPWYQQNTKDASRVVADNVILLVISPRVTDDMAAASKTAATWLAPSYHYDSRLADNTSSTPSALQVKSDGTVTQGTQNLLPPLVAVTMVALDEPSADKWATKMQNLPVDFLQESGASFSTAATYSQDVASLKTYLSGLRLNYRVFTATVVLRNARWDAATF